MGLIDFLSGLKTKVENHRDTLEQICEDKNLEVSGSEDIGALATLIAAIEAGGGHTFTFTPSDTGLVLFDIEEPSNIRAFAWERIDKRPFYGDSEGTIDNTDVNECFAGFNFIANGYTTNTKQSVFGFYNSSSSYYSPKAYAVAMSLNSASQSSTTRYGTGMLRYMSGNYAEMSFYANDTGARGIRVGGIYGVYIIRD